MTPKQTAALEAYRRLGSISAAAREIGVDQKTLREHIRRAEAKENADPATLAAMAAIGSSLIPSMFWTKTHPDGTVTHSVQSTPPKPGVTPEDFAEAIREILSETIAAAPVPTPNHDERAKDLANWFFLADLHIGGDYGDPQLSRDFEYTIDDLVARMPKAHRAVLFELGDILDANDHKGVTPNGGNPTDTIRDNHFGNSLEALRLMKYAIYRLLETHEEVEIYMCRGNHDETAYFTVLVGLIEHFRENPRLKVYLPTTPEKEEFVVVTWGECACLPNHGDKCKPEMLKEIFTDEFPDEYAAAKAFRLIATGHFHKLMVQSLGMTEHRQFGTIHKRNRWARQKFAPSRGQMSVLTVHKTIGLQDETISPIKTDLRGKSAP